MEKLQAGYVDDERVENWVETIETWAKRFSYGFDGYGEELQEDGPHANGPGLYVAFVSGDSLEDMADQAKSNPFYEHDGPTYLPLDVADKPESVLDEDEIDDAYDDMREIANDMDLGVVVWMNGRIHEYNVRFLPPSAEVREQVEDTDRGSRHQSAAETSARDDVVMTITLSEEDGTVTKYRNGEQEGREHTHAEISEEFARYERNAQPQEPDSSDMAQGDDADAATD